MQESLINVLDLAWSAMPPYAQLCNCTAIACAPRAGCLACTSMPCDKSATTWEQVTVLRGEEKIKMTLQRRPTQAITPATKKKKRSTEAVHADDLAVAREPNKAANGIEMHLDG